MPVCGPPSRIGEPLAVSEPETTIELLAVAGYAYGQPTCRMRDATMVRSSAIDMMVPRMAAWCAVTSASCTGLSGEMASGTTCCSAGLIVVGAVGILQPEEIAEDALRLGEREVIDEIEQQARVVQLVSAVLSEAPDLEHRDRQRVGHVPRARGETEQPELRRRQRRIGRDVGQELVHAVGERLQRHATLREAAS